jgi:hypothetical protein
VAVQHFEQFDQYERSLGFAVQIVWKGIRPAAENLRRLTLINIKFLADCADEGWIDDGGIHLLAECLHVRTD